LLGLWRERVEPVELGAAPEFEVDDRRQPQLLRRQGPAAGAVKAPFGEPPAGLGDPVAEGRGECRPAVIDLAVLLTVGIAAVEDVDAQAVEPLAARRLEPPDATL